MIREDDSEDEGGSEVEIEEDEELVGHEATHIPNFEYDREDPPMAEGSTYPSMNEFKLALSMHAVKHEFEFKIDKSSPYRFRAHCRRKDLDKCPWRIYASTMDDQRTVKVRKNRCAHECSSTRRKKKVKNATKHWICEKVKDFLIDDATLKAKALQKKIKERYKVHIHYKRVYMGRILALNQLYGDWDRSFDNLYRLKAQIETCSPGSIVNIDHYTINGKIRFRRMFFALKPCLDGFLNGCRPYLAVDSTFLTGRFKGQLATASAVDGHNWLYPVCFGVFDSETNDNWIWFMNQIRQLLMIKWNQRRKVAKKWEGRVLPHIIHKLNEQSRELSLEVDECSEEVAEVTAMGGSGFRFVVNLEEKTCSCRKWQVCGIPCKHALAFITSLPNASIEDYVHEYYHIDKFRAAYHQLIPAMPDKSQWPKSTHGFHLYPPLLKATAGRPKTERYKGCSENKKKKGMHQCPICKDYGHHWHRCKKGNPEDIAAMMAIRGPPKKKAKTTQSAQSSIVATEDDAPAASMSFPPSQTLDSTSKIKGKQIDSISGGSKCQSLETTSKTNGSHGNSNSVPSKRRMSRSGSNQPETIAVDRPPLKKATATRKKKDKPKASIPMLPFDSPAMGTRSKRVDPASPAMSTRSKRRLSL
ncbi:hypothetical protein U9M48_021025 [Paspalum notatum var. saurae]|uniref:SWIM-type domain-containing protein n=1 Tax=Paspalum notatum var. saurae TaxID=547442 RepID=A0AAQ3TI83_PASNO